MNKEQMYYNLRELIPITNLKYRQLKTRVKDVYEKFSDDKNELIYKKSNRWFIHKSILNEFDRKRKHIDFKLFITINPEGNYPSSELKSLVRHIKDNIIRESPSERIKYVLEHDNREYLHLHIMTTFDNQKKIRKYIRSHILSETQLNIHMKKLFFQEQVREKTEYMSKENKPVLIRY